MLGRNDGDKKYVGIFNIISTSKIFKIAENAVKRLTDLILTKPDQITYEHFSDINDPDYNNKTVPIIINLTDEEFRTFEKQGNRFNRPNIINLLKTKVDWIKPTEYDLHNLIEMTAPTNVLKTATKTKQTAYQKLIMPGVESSLGKRRMVIGLKYKGTKFETSKCWGIFIDIVLKNRIIIYRWNGTSV